YPTMVEQPRRKRPRLENTSDEPAGIQSRRILEGRESRPQEPKGRNRLRTPPARTTCRRYSEKRTTHRANHGGDQENTGGTVGMNNSWPRVPLGDLLARYTKYIDELEPREYPKLSVKLYGKGVVLDTPANGANLKMMRHQLAKAGQVILSEIWGKKGAIG